jgi:cytoskeletal protein CcmA (bactofilin family)
MGIFGTQKRDGAAEPALTADDKLEQLEHLAEDIPSLPKPLPNTLIAKGVTVTGAIHGQGVVEVEGTVEGELELVGSVIVSASGHVSGPITADAVRIAGKVQGCVTARDHLWLENTGSVEGDLSAAALVVEDGGRMNGRATVLKKEKKEKDKNKNQNEKLQFGPEYQAEGEKKKEKIS